MDHVYPLGSIVSDAQLMDILEKMRSIADWSISMQYMDEQIPLRIMVNESSRIWNSPRNAFEVIPNRGHVSEIGPFTSGTQGSYVGSSSPPLEKPQSEGKKKHRNHTCVMM